MENRLNDKRSIASCVHVMWLTISLGVLAIGLVFLPFKGIDYSLIGTSLVSILMWIGEMSLDMVDRYLDDC